MAMSWTKEQQQVIDLRKRNILVSAAAGSGKTAVLVERIVGMITDEKEPVDIDHLLIVTFTNAAAAEMRERIGAAIETSLEENPQDENLQKQLTLIHNAQITTIDSFCLYVIRNHFYEIDLEPTFRIADEGELKLLKEDVLKELLEQNYETGAPEFLSFVESYAPGRSDEALNGMILDLYGFSRSYPWPDEWLNECAKGYHVESEEELNSAAWIVPLVSNIRYVAKDLVRLMEQALEMVLSDDGPYMYEKIIRSDMEKYKYLAGKVTFTELKEAFFEITYDRLPSSRGFDGDAVKLEQVKAMRNRGKDTVKKINSQYFYCSIEQMIRQLNQTAQMAEELVRLASSFADAFAAEKKKKNIVDFHDLEHFALEILVDQETKETRKTAEEFRDTFEEIMIDEYQDSNYVQETILRAISREARGSNNIFMVGDVKQSIYRFRLARPELFMEKYDTYSFEEGSTQRIDLHKNFRSRKEVLEFTNDIFYKIMQKDLGNVSYDERAALYAGAQYPDMTKDMSAPEVLLVDGSEEILADSVYQNKRQLEAKLISQRIQKMMKEQLVTDKKSGELRPVRYSDIVILLRSLSGWADTFAAVLNADGIPAHAVSSTGYFSAVEVQTVLSMLRILDNPRQDIPLAAVLRSPIVGMTDEDLAKLRLILPDESFYACVLNKCEQIEGNQKEALQDKGQEASEEKGLEPYEQKLKKFYRLYQRLRKLVPDTPIHELIEVLLKETGYGSYAAAMPAGERRQANLFMLLEKAIAYENTSYKGLFHFVRYIDELQKYDIDFGEADLISENENVVRIMSIHKSKGLEFPVVFVAGLGKQFNRQDVRSRMVLHPDLGMGLDCMDGERRLKTPTILKKAVAKQIDLENLGEELRVLYVALTRAKEKLILTADKKDALQVLEAGRESADTLPKEGAVSYLFRESAAGYLDWLLPALCSYGNKYDLRAVSAAELVTEEISLQTEHILDKEACLYAIRQADEEKVEQYDKIFSFCYPNAANIDRKNKYSVSELKHRAMRKMMEQEEGEVTPVFVEDDMIPYVPAFVRRLEDMEESVNRGALRGTAVHRVMECFRFSAEEGAIEQMDAMLADGRITEDMKELVIISQIDQFLKSDAGIRMRRAESEGRLYREKPFVMGLSAAELAEFGFGDSTVGECDEDNLTLVQGIIDVFWIEEDGIVVLDYKTDRVDTAKQLQDRYAAQLALYGEALERIYNDKGERSLRVKERLLYSFRLGEVIGV